MNILVNDKGEDYVSPRNIHGLGYRVSSNISLCSVDKEEGGAGTQTTLTGYEEYQRSMCGCCCAFFFSLSRWEGLISGERSNPTCAIQKLFYFLFQCLLRLPSADAEQK